MLFPSHFADLSEIRMHYIDEGQGPPLLFCHGFPELWYSWRHQIETLSRAGYRCIAPDLRGYGQTSAPEPVQSYSQQKIMQDLIDLLDHLEIDQAIWIGHDWGGIVVWAAARAISDRVQAVAGLNTPLFKHMPVDPLKLLQRRPGQFAYQLYFQEPGLAEVEFEENPARAFHVLFQSAAGGINRAVLRNASRTRKLGNFLGDPELEIISDLLSAEDIKFYVENYRIHGFRGPLNWYRNMTINWQWESSFANTPVKQAALMITAGKDFILKPELSKGMEKTVLNLTRAHIEDCSHWTQQEHPDEVNRILLNWLESNNI